MIKHKQLENYPLKIYQPHETNYITKNKIKIIFTLLILYLLKFEGSFISFIFSFLIDKVCIHLLMLHFLTILVHLLHENILSLFHFQSFFHIYF
jgi:hypothetical protein